MLGKDFSGSVVKYVWTTAGPEPIEKRQHALDYDHYVEKQLRPIADTVLSFFGVNFDDILKNSKQKTLFGY
jgi:DNA polymerase-2